MSRPTKLELTWVGKNERTKLEPRVLVEDPARSYPPSPDGLPPSPFGLRRTSRRAGGDPTAENTLIFGDNMLALKALAAIRWCEVASGVGSKPWEYKLVPDDVVGPTRTFAFVVSHAIRVP